MPKFKVQVDKLVVYEIEIDTDMRHEALSAAVEIMEGLGEAERAMHLKHDYELEAHYAEEVKPKTRRKE